jgi:hypothetical protein
MPSIHTLNARGNVMLPVMREYFSWSDARAFREIQRFHRDCLDILQAKGIRYEALRSALTPQPGKQEAAFMFDEHRCDPDRIPGVDAADALFKLLPGKTTHSVLGGELVDDKDEIARRLLGQTAVIAKDLAFKHPCFCYNLYVNNLSDEALNALHTGLQAHPGYLGYVPCTYASLAKTFVAMHLVNLAIKHAGIVILGHEDDRDNRENCNLQLHDYTALGLQIRSLQEIYFSAFLSYKPERMLLQDSDDDLEMALRAMSDAVTPLSEFTVVIEDDKFDKYLRTKKLGKLQNAGLAQLTKTELEAAIGAKMRSNYLYNIDWRDEPDYQGSFFNIMLEFPRAGGYPERMTAALEYKVATKVLRLVTLA